MRSTLCLLLQEQGQGQFRPPLLPSLFFKVRTLIISLIQADMMPLRQGHVVIRKCFCRPSFIDQVEKTDLPSMAVAERAVRDMKLGHFEPETAKQKGREILASTA